MCQDYNGSFHPVRIVLIKTDDYMETILSEAFRIKNLQGSNYKEMEEMINAFLEEDIQKILREKCMLTIMNQ